MPYGLSVQSRKSSGKQLKRKDLSFTHTFSYILSRLLTRLRAHLENGTPQLADVQNRYNEFLSRLQRVSDSLNHVALSHNSPG